MSNVDPNAEQPTPEPAPEPAPDSTPPPEEVPQPATTPPVEDQTAQNTGGPVTTDQTVNPDASGGKTPEQVAREVLAGQWGRGHRRAERLQLAGYDRAAIQHELNRLLRTDEFRGVENRGVDNTVDTRESATR